MPDAARRIVVLSLGWIFVLLGIAGLFLPILQGVLFLTIGLILMSRESRWVRRRLDWARRRWPRFGRAWDRAHATMHRIANRVFRRGKDG
jgi:uncharacterized protein